MLGVSQGILRDQGSFEVNSFVIILRYTSIFNCNFGFELTMTIRKFPSDYLKI